MKIKTTTLIYLSVMAMALLYACKDEDENPRLVVDFTADKQSITAGEAVTFSDKSVGNPTKWNWYFEGGTPASSNLHSPEVVYEAPGTYAVKLVVGRGNDSTQMIQEGFIEVGYAEITADFSASANSAVEGESLTFTDLSEGHPTSWSWEFIPASGETITSTEENPTITFTTAGIYTVRLTATNPAGTDEEVKADYINIIDPDAVIADFNASAQGTYTGGSVNFTDASLGRAESWSWTFEGGTPATSTEQNPVVTYSTPGRYKVTLQTSNPINTSLKEVDNYILVVPSSDLAAFFPFDGNANDAGPNNLTTSLMGTIAFTGTDRNTVENKTALFNGAEGIIVDDHTALNFGTAPYSVSCWVKTDNSSKMMIWQESGDKGSKDNQTWLRLNSNTTSNRVQLATEDANGGSFIGLSEAQHGKTYDNIWHHIVCVREGLMTRIYVDGVEAGSKESLNGVKEVSNSGAFKIGFQRGTNKDTGEFTYGSYYIGALDDVIIYNKALTATEVTELFGL